MRISDEVIVDGNWYAALSPETQAQLDRIEAMLVALLKNEGIDEVPFRSSRTDVVQWERQLDTDEGIKEQREESELLASRIAHDEELRAAINRHLNFPIDLSEGIAVG